MRPISDHRLNVILILSDGKGHTNADISRLLGPKDKDRPGKKKGYDGYDRGDLSKELSALMDLHLVDKRNDHYHLTSSKETFAYIMDNSNGSDSGKFYEKFLESEYINNIIDVNSFMQIVSVISSRLADMEFRDIAAPRLLSHPAAIDAYKDLLESIEEYFTSMVNAEAIDGVRKEFEKKRMQQKEKSNPAFERYAYSAIDKARSYDGKLYANNTGNLDKLDILRELGIEGVRFYRRSVLHGSIRLFTRRLRTPKNNKFIIKYVRFDNYLGPFTAYPVNNPVELMFTTAFSRLFEDAYIIDPKDIGILLKRANVVFQNFHEFARIYAGSRNYKEAAIREMIHNWNIAAARLEAILGLLGQIGYDQEKSCYHLTREGAGFQIVDLGTDERLLGESDMEMLEAANLNTGFHEFDQTKYLRPVLLGDDPNQDWQEQLVPVESIMDRMDIDTQ